MKTRTRNILLLIPLAMSAALIATNCIVNKGLVFCEHCWPSFDFSAKCQDVNWEKALDIVEYVFMQIPTSIVHTYTRNVDLANIMRCIGVENTSCCGAINLVLGVAFLLCSIKLLCILFAKDKTDPPKLSEHKSIISTLIGMIVLLEMADHNPIVIVGLLVAAVFFVVCWRKSRGGGSSGILEDLKNIKIKVGGD